MSALGGIFNFGNNPPPVDRPKLAALGKLLAVRGPDGGGEACNAHVGMTYRAYHTTYESQFEVQPIVTTDGHMLTWDGRLDNRDDLIAELFIGPPRERFITDAEIVLTAYQRWGEKSFARLIGDFGMALWNPHVKTLFLVRDVLGTRPINYYLNREGIVWSSELLSLLDVAEVPREVDEEYIAGFLSRYPPWGRTPYKNVFGVKPQHFVSVTQDGQFQETSYWALDPNRVVHYARDEEYEEHFLHAFNHGLKQRLRSHRPVFIEVSGGLDSSSIACVSDRFVKDREVQASRMELISYLYDESPTADESEFIKCIEQHLGRTGHHLKESQYPVLAHLNHAPTAAPNGVDAFAEYYHGLRETMDHDDARVLLSGEGGDQMLCSSDDPSPELCDLLVQGKYLTLHKRLQVWSTALKRPYSWLLWQRTIIPTLPGSFQLNLVNTIPPWFDSKFVARAHLKERMNSCPDHYGFRLPSSRDQSLGFISVVNHIALGYRRDRLNPEIRYPYLHRPLIEFLQAIPFEQRVRPGETRSLLRRALKTSLPERIARRRTKGNPHEAVCRAVCRQLPRLRMVFDDARVSAYGFVDSRALLNALELAKHGLTINLVALLKTLSLEFWLRTLEHPGSLSTAADCQKRFS
ncbi:MAG TPA: asparagine synthase-related protein [Pyrinomonadaceae bacterium]|nr:asparagine synthase-related protein [Pyrinomonadaceae bacterium]